MAAPRSILVPVDGSAPSLEALAHAVALAEDNPLARVDVLHVVAPEDFRVGSGSPLTDDARREADLALDAAVQQARAELRERLAQRTEAGDPLLTIIEVAREGKYDLIVIGTHGRIGRLHALVGSVTEALVRNAPCPVLTVRDSDGGYQSFAERRHGRPALRDAPATRH